LFLNSSYYNIGDLMNTLEVIFLLSLIGFLLYLLFSKEDFFFQNIYRKRSGKDRRKGFYATKNRMRRTEKDRRQTKG